jgi:hypothetical protein
VMPGVRAVRPPGKFSARCDEFRGPGRYVLVGLSLAMGKANDEERTMTETRPEDVAAIKGVLEGLYKAWDAGDADAFVADYTEDATAILPGSYRKSKEDIRQNMAGWVPVERIVYATWALEKRDGAWLLAAYHNCPTVLPG